MAGMSLSLMVSLVTVVVIRHQVPSAGMQCCLSISPSGLFFGRSDFSRGLELIVFDSASNVEEKFCRRSRFGCQLIRFTMIVHFIYLLRITIITHLVKNRVNREFHVQFREELGVQLPLLTRLAAVFYLKGNVFRKKCNVHTLVYLHMFKNFAPDA
jgi:hypothetical protein